ncbi:MAG: esterase [Burkholderiales bacterium PBB6]|nr:MAG: esterase [Burkholderiales bacterium PBB6]
MSGDMLPRSSRRAWMQQAGTGLGLAVLGGAAVAAPAPATTSTAAPAPAPAAAGQGASVAKPRWALALGGGSARGFAHIGVLKSLDQAGLRPDVVVGTSAGALIGALYASGLSPWQIEEVALRIKDVEIADFASAGKRGMLAGEALARVVNDLVKGARLEQFKTRFVAVSTDLKTGEMVLLRQGPAGEAVRASCSIPGVFVPTEVNGRELVDGGLVAPLPARVARQQGADMVLAVDIAARPKRHDLNGLYEVVLQSFEIMGRALADQDAANADMVIRPDTGAWSSSDFSARREMIQAGYEATQRALPEIRKRLEAPRKLKAGL